MHAPRPPHLPRAGFTLIEISIVLVIIGLIVGGVLVGKDLIDAASYRKDISQIDKIRTAVNTFRLKYNALPGDMTESQVLSFFSNIPYNTTTYSGNGNGRIGDAMIDGSGNCGFVVTNSNGGPFGHGAESAEFYDQLARANLISLAPFDITDLNVAAFAGKGYPASALNSSVGLVVINPPTTNLNYFYWGAANQYPAPWNIVQLSMSNFSPTQSFLLDTKIDDGLPMSGNVLQWQDMCVTSAYQGVCQTGGVSSQYLSSNTRTNCGVAIVAGF